MQSIRPSQHGFMQGKSCVTNLVSFYDKITHLVDEGNTVNVIFLYFSKTFGTVPHSKFLDKLSDCERNRWTIQQQDWDSLSEEEVLMKKKCFQREKNPVWKTFSVKLFFKTPEIVYVKIRSCWQSLDPQLPGIVSSNLSSHVGK